MFQQHELTTEQLLETCVIIYFKEYEGTILSFTGTDHTLRDLVSVGPEDGVLPWEEELSGEESGEESGENSEEDEDDESPDEENVPAAQNLLEMAWGDDDSLVLARENIAISDEELEE